MIFFLSNDGTIVKSQPEQVYQGSANSNSIYVVAPFASGLTAEVAFRLANGLWTERKLMTPQSEVEGVVNDKTGETYSGWSYSMPNKITQYYGTVLVQFYFTAANGAVTASSVSSFNVNRGVPAELPETADSDTYAKILTQITALQTTVANMNANKEFGFTKTFTKADFTQITAERWVLVIKQSEHGLESPHVESMYVDEASLVDEEDDDEDDTTFATNAVYEARTLSTGTVKVYVTVNLSLYETYSGRVYLKGI